MSRGLGETAVSFDFGQEIDYKPFKSSPFNKDQEDHVLLQQIYILKGNGDVLLLLVDLYHPKYVFNIFKTLKLQILVEDVHFTYRNKFAL